jgi:hypothetical protein
MKNGLATFAFLMAFASVTMGQKAPTPPKYQIPDLNKRATLFVEPSLPDSLLMEELDGKTVSIRVVVDTDGNAEFVNVPIGYSELVRTAVEQAARDSKFEPFSVKGKRERYFGHLQYSFAYEKMDWFAFGTALESVHNFDNISVSPVAAKLTVRWADEKARLEAIDKLKDIDERIKTIAAMIGHFGTKLSGKDQWLFKTAVVVRNATFWGMVGGPIERESLRKALKDIDRVTKDVPADIPQEFIENLKKISEFTFDPAIGERELRQELMKLSMSLRNYPR